MVERTFELEVSKGGIHEHYPEHKFGRAPDGVQTTATTIWDRADATPTQQVWVAPTAPRVHAIVSSDADDTAAGTGARTLRIWGLASWTDTPNAPQITEDVTMNGTTPVNTVNSYVIINRMRVITAGSSASNEGTITATAATDSTVTAAIRPAEGSTQHCLFGVPNGWQAWLDDWNVQILKASGSPATINFRLWDVDYADPDNPVRSLRDLQGVQSNGTSYHDEQYHYPLRFTGPCIMLVEGIASAPDIDGASSLAIVITRKKRAAGTEIS